MNLLGLRASFESVGFWANGIWSRMHHITAQKEAKMAGQAGVWLPCLLLGKIKTAGARSVPDLHC